MSAHEGASPVVSSHRVDETPEELAQIRSEAAGIDVYKYSKRRRAIMALCLGSFLAGMTWLGIEMMDSQRNPCGRVRDYLCAQDPKSLPCTMYQGVFEESEQDEVSKMRGQIRYQCQTKIDRMFEEDGIKVP